MSDESAVSVCPHDECEARIFPGRKIIGSPFHAFDGSLSQIVARKNDKRSKRGKKNMPHAKLRGDEAGPEEATHIIANFVSRFDSCLILLTKIDRNHGN